MNNKHKKILQAVILGYIETGKPIASKYVSEKYGGLGYSASSIRNFMAQLEKDGYLKSLHKSSGKLPTNKGWRFYINDLIETQQTILKKKEELNNNYTQQIRNCNSALLDLSKLFFYILKHSNYNLLPDLKKTTFRELILSYVGKKTVSGTVLADTGVVKQFLIKTQKPVRQDFLDAVSNLLNMVVKGVALSDIKNLITTKKELFNKDLGEKFSFVLQNLNSFFDFENITGTEETNNASKISELLNRTEETAKQTTQT
ncbi:MAG: hypothetical protein AB1349_06340 [Elusimicrobiota bacterium]